MSRSVTAPACSGHVHLKKQLTDAFKRLLLEASLCHLLHRGFDIYAYCENTEPPHRKYFIHRYDTKNIYGKIENEFSLQNIGTFEKFQIQKWREITNTLLGSADTIHSILLLSTVR